MNNNFELLIKNNFSIIKTLFCITESSVKIVDENTRIFRKDFRMERLFQYIPVLKGPFEDVFPSLKVIPLIIKEKFEAGKLQFIYKLKFMEETIKNFKVIIKLICNPNNNQIYAYVDLKKKNNSNNFIIDEIAPPIIINYYKIAFLENELKPLISKLSHHFFALNII